MDRVVSGARVHPHGRRLGNGIAALEHECDQALPSLTKIGERLLRSSAGAQRTRNRAELGVTSHIIDGAVGPDVPLNPNLPRDGVVVGQILHGSSLPSDIIPRRRISSSSRRIAVLAYAGGSSPCRATVVARSEWSGSRITRCRAP